MQVIQRARRPARASLVLAWSLVACADPPAPPPPPPPPPPTPAPIAAPRAFASATAFDLVASVDSVFLAWGAPAAQGGGVRLLELAPGGAARGAERELARRSAAAGGSAEDAPLQISELSMAAAAGHLGVAWVVTPRDESVVEATYAATAGAFTAARELGPIERYDPHARGGIVVSSGVDGTIWVMRRQARGPCRGQSGDCTHFTRERLDTSGGGGRGDEPLELTTPCDPLLSGSLTLAGRWYYAICHGGESPATTVYVIDPAVSYAAAAEVLPGCTPVGLAPGGTGAMLRAHCPDGDALARVDGQGRVAAAVRAADFTPRCEAGRPVLSARSDAAATLALTGSESRLEGWLPESIAPPGARAVWTGEALLVAAPVSGEVSLRRYECVEGNLSRTDMR